MASHRRRTAQSESSMRPRRRRLARICPCRKTSSHLPPRRARRYLLVLLGQLRRRLGKTFSPFVRLYKFNLNAAAPIWKQNTAGIIQRTISCACSRCCLIVLISLQTQVWVAGLDKGTRADEVTEVFSQAGQMCVDFSRLSCPAQLVCSFDIQVKRSALFSCIVGAGSTTRSGKPPSRDYCFVTYQTPGEARRAIQLFDSTQNFGTTPLSVKLSRPKPGHCASTVIPVSRCSAEDVAQDVAPTFMSPALLLSEPSEPSRRKLSVVDPVEYGKQYIRCPLRVCFVDEVIGPRLSMSFVTSCPSSDRSDIHTVRPLSTACCRR